MPYSVIPLQVFTIGIKVRCWVSRIAQHILGHVKGTALIGVGLDSGMQSL